eukprot:4585886-Pyramimonas_sp.AAC.2
MRRGWTSVMMKQWGLTIRGAFGPLPGQLLSVGRAGRYAVLMSLKPNKHLHVVFTDLLALAGRFEVASGTHATIWRQIKALPRGRRPHVLWAPAHKSLQD